MRRGLVLLVAGFLLIPTASVLAQTTGDIEGKIIDLSGVGTAGRGGRGEKSEPSSRAHAS